MKEDNALSPKSGDCALYGAQRLRELPLSRLNYINTIVVAICLYSSLTRQAEEGAAQGLPQDVSFLTGQDVTSDTTFLKDMSVLSRIPLRNIISRPRLLPLAKRDSRE